MKVTKHSKNVHAIECGRTQEFLLLSDLHWDNPKCDRALLTNHLEEARRRGAKVLVNGDFFCCSYDYELFHIEKFRYDYE